MCMEGSTATFVEGEDGVALSGSEAGAWYQEDCLGTWEIQGVLPSWEEWRTIRRGKEATMTLWKSDQPIEEA